MKWRWSYLLNPLGAVADYINDNRGVSEEAAAYKRANNGSLDGYTTAGQFLKGKWNQFSNWLGDRWNDITGQTAIQKEFENNMDLAKYQNQMEEEMYNKYSSPEAIVNQLKAANLNPNLAYGSATSGQGNVPSFSSPAAAHQLSYTDKLNKALSIISSVQGVKNLIYQTVANREAAEQSAIRTANMFTTLRQNRMKTDLLGEQIGYNGGGVSAFFRNSSLGRRKSSVTAQLGEPLGGLIEYAGALRSEVLNRSYNQLMNNYWMHGSGYSKNGYDFFDNGHNMARNYWLNYGTEYQAKGRQFDYDWNNDYKTMLKGAGVAAPIVQTLLRLLGGK